MQGYQMQKKLGQGAYGSVYKAKSIKNNQYFAIKVIKIEAYDDGIPSTTIREINILKTVNHPNIVKLFNVELVKYIEPIPQIHLCFEYIENDLSNYMKQNSLSTYNAKIFFQILKGVQYLHENKIYHRDLKPQNILLANDFTTKIADFGLSRIIQIQGQKLSRQIQTLWYRAPQVLLGCEKYDFGVDIWSLGCILYEIIEGSVLFQSDCEIGQIFTILYKLGTPNIQENQEIINLPYFKNTFPKYKPTIMKQFNLLDQHGIDLLLRFLRYNPKQRISVRQALFHPYFDDIRRTENQMKAQ